MKANVPPGYEAIVRVEHRLGNGHRWDEMVDLLVPRLAELSGPGSACHFALWSGWGWSKGSYARTTLSSAGHAADTTGDLDRQMRPVQRFLAACPVAQWWGGRGMYLFDGPLEAVTQIGSPVGGRQGPQWWWPVDRAWLVSSEIDDAFSYVAGPRPLIDDVLALDTEATTVSRHDPA